jgi:LEA14-like dessication related protein
MNLPVTRVAATALVLSLLACSPKAPIVTPQAARVLWAAPSGLRLAIEVNVYNPNSFSLVANSIDGVLKLGNGAQFGQGQAYPGGAIPAEGASRVVTQFDVRWTNLTALAPFLLSPSPVPYVFEGNAHLGTESASLNVPFQVQGQLTRAELLGAGLRGL